MEWQATPQKKGRGQTKPLACRTGKTGRIVFLFQVFPFQEIPVQDDILLMRIASRDTLREAARRSKAPFCAPRISSGSACCSACVAAV